MVNDVTIVVVPWQHYGETAGTLESIYAFTGAPVRLVYVDGNSPPDVQRYLQQQAQRRGFTLIRSDRYLTSSEARNLALAHVQTKYVAFLDNGAFVTQGWLEKLVRCAEETGAWVVEPLYCYGDAANPTIYSYAPELRIEERGGIRTLVETAPLFRTPLADARAALQRAPAGYAKFHCALIRSDVLARLHAFDEGYANYQDHRDFGLAVQHAGGTIYCEPDAVAMLIEAPRLRWSDAGLFLLRWSNAWLRPSIRHFSKVWRIDENDEGLQGGTRFRNVQRRALFSRVRRFARRLAGWRGVAAVDAVIDAVFDRVLEPAVVARLERRRQAEMRPPAGNARLRAVGEAESDV